MSNQGSIFILGAGAIGLSLAAHLVNEGKRAIAVRTSHADMAATVTNVTVSNGSDVVIKAPVEMISLSRLERLDGTIVVTAKSPANRQIVSQIKDKRTESPIIIMQNGIGVETPFQEAGFSEIYRCVLIVTSQKTGPYDVIFRAVTASPIGIIEGNSHSLKMCVEQLSTPGFGFRVENHIQREIWKKGIINSVFNTICPLLEVDNGIFMRDEEVAGLANEIIAECLQVTAALGLDLGQAELMDQVLRISSVSAGQLISTLQDIQNRRETEIKDLNLEIARIAAEMSPRINVDQTKLLGTMTLLKSKLSRSDEN